MAASGTVTSSDGGTIGEPAAGRRRPGRTPKGRQVDPRALEEVRSLLGSRPRRRDLLIEHLHLIQDHRGHLSAAHLAATTLPPGPAQPSACRQADMTVATWKGVPGSSGAGHVEADIAFQNTSSPAFALTVTSCFDPHHSQAADDASRKNDGAFIAGAGR